MSINSEDFVLTRDNRIFVRNRLTLRFFFIALIGAILSIFIVGIYLSNKESIKWDLAVYFGPLFPLMYLIWVILPRLNRKTIRIDKSGVSIESDVGSVNYPWGDLIGVDGVKSRIPTHGSFDWAQANAPNSLMISRRNDILRGGDRVVIQNEFDLSLELLVGMIRSGIERWGNRSN